MAREPLGHKSTTIEGDPGSAGYQGSTGASVGASVGGVVGGAVGAAPIGAAIGGLIGLIGDLFASGSGSRKPKPAKLRPQVAERGTVAPADTTTTSDPGSSSAASKFGPDIRLQAAQNLGRRFG